MTRWQWTLKQAWRSLGLPGWTAAALCVVCAGLWLGVSAPLAREAQRLAAQTRAIERQLATQAQGTVEPTPQQQLETFGQRFPDAKGITPALARLHALARKRGVTIEQAEFKLSQDSAEPLARYTMVLPVKADYASLRRFTREAMRELPGLALEDVQLRRSDAKATQLESTLRLTLFLSKAV
jgi:hypothetical protein